MGLSLEPNEGTKLDLTDGKLLCTTLGAMDELTIGTYDVSDLG